MRFFHIPALFLCSIILSAGLTSCVDGGLNSVPGQKDFWLINMTYDDYDTNSSAWYQVAGINKAETDHCAVFVDSDLSFTTAAAEAVAEEFENTIYPLVTGYFADPLDVDNNGKVFILLTDIIDGGSSSSYMGGYFYSTDFYSTTSVNSYNSSYGTCYKTNECEVLYIDAVDQPMTVAKGLSTIAHEFQHMVNASYRLSHKYDVHDTWIDEGLAESSSHLCYGEQSGRITYYNSILYKDQFQQGHPLFYWDYSGDVLANYSLSYLFFQYLCAQSSGGDGIFRDIITSSSSDYNAVVNAIGKDTGLLSHYSADASIAFNHLLLRFYATNAGVEGTKYGYGDRLETSLTAPGEVIDTTPTLKSGGGVYREDTGMHSVSTSGFIYMSVSSTGTGEDFTSSYSANDYFIAVNRSYYPDSEDETTTAVPTSISSSESSVLSATESSGRSGTVDSSPHMIDFVPPRLPLGSLPSKDEE